MRKIALFAASILLTLSCSCAFATELEVTWNNVNFRQSPGGQVLGRVSHGDLLTGTDEVYAACGLWYQAHSEQWGDGYISAEFARPVWNGVYLYQEDFTGIDHVTDNMVDYLAELNAYLYTHGICVWDSVWACPSVIPMSDIKTTPEHIVSLACMLQRHGMLVENHQTAVLTDERASDSQRAQAASEILKKHYGTDDIGVITYRGNFATGFHPSDWHTHDMNSTVDSRRLEQMMAQINAPYIKQGSALTASETTPPSTVLYYNPDGGSRYHIDINCPSISPKYLPLSGRFSWEQVSEPAYRDLAPCNICGAPPRE